MSGNKRKISSGSEISFSELKQLAEDGDAIAQNKLAIRYKNGIQDLSLVPRICLDFLIFRKATSNKKRELKAIQFPFLLGVF